MQLLPPMTSPNIILSLLQNQTMTVYSNHHNSSSSKANHQLSLHSTSLVLVSMLARKASSQASRCHHLASAAQHSPSRHHSHLEPSLEPRNHSHRHQVAPTRHSVVPLAHQSTHPPPSVHSRVLHSCHSPCHRSPQPPHTNPPLRLSMEAHQSAVHPARHSMD